MRWKWLPARETATGFLWSLALEANSIHPVGRAIIAWARSSNRSDGQALPDIAEFEIEHSAEGGLVARGTDCEVLIGTRKLLLQHGAEN